MSKTRGTLATDDQDRTQVWLPLPSEFGDIGLVASPTGLCGLVLPELEDSRVSIATLVHRQFADARRGTSPILVEFTQALKLYLAGGISAFDGTLDYGTASPFEQAVWDTTRTIPFGVTRPYAWVADAAGDPHAVRAVGRALGRNPVPVVVPCHRVIAADGTIGGFTGGLAMKRALLAFEGVAAKGRQTELPL